MRRLVPLLLLAVFAFGQEEPEAKPAELHKIYVPYKKLEEILGTDKERVMVPYKEFLELWKLRYGPDRAATKPPVPFALESAAYTGRVADGIASFSVAMEIEVFEESWQRVPLAFRDVAFEEVAVDGAPGVLVPTKKGYDLILRGKGRHAIEARFVAGVAQGKEFATTAFGLPPVPLHRLTFTVPGKGTEVKIDPARALSTTNEGDTTRVLAFLGPQSGVKLTWRSLPEETDREPPLVFATDTVDVRVEERVLRGSAQFDLEVLRAPASRFTILVPEGVQILEVAGKDIRTWSFADEARRKLLVVLHKEVSGRYALRVGFEGPVEVPGSLAVPVLGVEGAARERGHLRVSSAEGVGLRRTAGENIFQVDLNALPKPIRGGTRALGFRFPSAPYSLGLRTERIAPLVSLVTRARLEVERHSYRFQADLHFKVERAGVFAVRVELPAALRLEQIGNPKLVDSWREEERDGVRTLTLALRGRRIGSFVLPLRGVAPLDLAAGKLAVPLLRVLDVDREEGTLGVFMDPGIKAVATTTGVVPLEPRKFRESDGFASQLPLAFGWRWRGGEKSVDFAVEARKPKVTADVRYALEAAEARIEVNADVVYRIEYTGVESVRFRMPKSIAEKVKVEAREIREKSFLDDEVAEGAIPTVTWTVQLHSPALGELTLQVRYDTIFDQPLETNQRLGVAIEPITPLGVERSNTFVAIRKAPVIKVEADAADYEQIDTAELPPALRGKDVFLALRRYEAPAGFRLDVEKHRYQPVADLVVRHTHVTTEFSSPERARTIAIFEILNNDRQFLALQLPAGSQVQELLVGGKPEKPGLGDGGVLLIKLITGMRKDATFEVSIDYTHPVETRGALFRTTRLEGPTLPGLPDAPAPFQSLLTWRVHTPKAWRLTGFDGNVQPAGPDAYPGSWMRRAIDSLGRLVRPVKNRTDDGRTIQPLHSTKDKMLTSDTVATVLTNGTGDGQVVVSHTSVTVQVVFVLLASAIGIALVVFLGRAFPVGPAGGAIALGVLVMLTFSGPGWLPIWNGMLLGTVLATLALRLAARKGATA